jgi:hypothetical protein
MKPAKQVELTRQTSVRDAEIVIITLVISFTKFSWLCRSLKHGIKN